MKITVNNKPIELPNASQVTLAEFLASQDIPDKGVAAALNGKVVRRTQWAETVLADGDSVTIIKAVCGG